MEEEAQPQPQTRIEIEDDLYGIDPEHVRKVEDALREGRAEHARALAEPLHYSDAADLLERLEPEDRVRLVEALRPDFDPEILTELDESVRDEVIAALGFADLAAAVAELDSDDAVWLVSQLSDEERARVMDALPAELGAVVLHGLSYPEYTAGRMMQRELVAVPAYWTVGEAFDFLRTATSVPDAFHDLYVVDPRHRPIGKIGLDRLVRARRQQRLNEVMDDEGTTVPAAADQEEVAFLFRQHDLMSAPVVDGAGRLVGTITIDDVVDVIDEEAADDMLRLAGVSDTDLYRAVKDTVRARIPWLLINTVTAVAASAVIGLFEATLEKIVALAVLMPIVAGLGGNAGTQTLAVAVRSLATKELAFDNAFRVIGKEVLVGIFNGIAIAALIGPVAWIWFGEPALGMVIAAALVFNLLIAGLMGSVIPLTLERLGVDPAVASSIFLTVFTDTLGFFAFLGLATIFLL
ncbi:magnesium transporter [Magnetospirillum sp. UT-4]|uniref:magnesium transporter n=1 Tax=Magnetospirillum sp. UT-4 TaxID=2681467 RepID=UPI0013801877|nr:magnesium transporter [Magnetospirillum sp. UT-4]CAA7613218.1 Divalent cation transporter [Magnetospirillum sp. UT-4]